MCAFLTLVVFEIEVHYESVTTTAFVRYLLKESLDNRRNQSRLAWDMLIPAHLFLFPLPAQVKHGVEVQTTFEEKHSNTYQPPVCR